MFNKILLAVDGSPQSKEAATEARELAAKLGSEVLVVHVTEMRYSGAAVWSPEPYLELDAFVEDVVDGLRSEGLEARHILVDALNGHTGKAIADLSTEEKADLIVLGRSGHSQLPGLFLGNVATRALHYARCSVLIAGGADVHDRGRPEDWPS
ncbi:MAG: universal stress protein [Actinomycetota bacterium]|nr:universal stress protein [Actinomycetota bacterium]